MYQFNQFLGFLCIIFGAWLFAYVMGSFLFRIFFAVVALYLISHGLRLCGFPPLPFVISSWVSRGRF